MDDLWVNLRSSGYWTAEQIAKIEEHYGASFIADLSIWNEAARFWSDRAYPVFWQENPPEGYSNYFFVNVSHGKVMIGKADLKDRKMVGVLTASGEIIFSRHRHDFVAAEDGTFIDGGREYTRMGGESFVSTLTLYIDGPEIVLLTKHSSDNNEHKVRIKNVRK